MSDTVPRDQLENPTTEQLRYAAELIGGYPAPDPAPEAMRGEGEGGALCG